MENEISRLAAHNDRLAQQRQELEERCAQLIEENTTLKNTNSFEQTERDQMRDRLAATESERDKHKKRLADFQEAMWLVMGDRIMDEIICSGAIESIAEDVMSDCDITQHSYFESAVNDVVNNYDFDEILDDNLSDKVAQVIGDGEFIFRR
tara:strand:+ start:187 stop:639 length:453 start_codon:yes stop_codon:yes gene_type:complete